jgi:hypothetical protein
MVLDPISSDLVDNTISAKAQVPPALFLEGMQVNAGSVSAVIRIASHNQQVDERLAAAILALHPHLVEHVCKQRGYGRFGDKLVGATLPHLVEHVAIDLLVADEQRQTLVAGAQRQTQRQPSKPEERQQHARGARAGTTTWLDRKQGTMRVRVSRLTDTADTAEDANRVCAAITRAIALVNSLLAR